MSRIVQNVEEVVLAVNHQDEVVALFEDLFELEFKESWSVPVDNMNVKCARIGNTQFHIVSSTSPNAVIAKFLRERGEGIHHIAFKVKHLDGLVARLKSKGIRVVPDKPREGRDARYIFVHPASVHGILIELIERQ